MRILARELTQLRELRDKEVNELINFNSQLQVVSNKGSQLWNNIISTLV